MGAARRWYRSRGPVPGHSSVAVVRGQVGVRLRVDLRHAVDVERPRHVRLFDLVRVDVQDHAAHIHGKVWKRGEPEPDTWTIEGVDPHPNLNGSPGLYVYTLAPCYYDNVIVSKSE